MNFKFFAGKKSFHFDQSLNPYFVYVYQTPMLDQDQAKIYFVENARVEFMEAK